jgi:hypothetical protein
MMTSICQLYLRQGLFDNSFLTAQGYQGRYANPANSIIGFHADDTGTMRTMRVSAPEEVNGIRCPVVVL